MKKLRIIIPIILAVILFGGAALFFFLPRPEAVYAGDGQAYGKILKTNILSPEIPDPFDEYTVPYYRGFLNEQEIFVYSALKYAYSNNISSLKLKTDLSGDRIFDILVYLKCDLPQMLTSTAADKILIEKKTEEHLFRSEEWTVISLPDIELETVKINYAALTASIDYFRQTAAGFQDGMSEFDKAKLLYETLSEKAVYSTDGSYSDGKAEIFTIKGALADNASQCDGFASAYQLLCGMAGIKSTKVFYRGSDSTDGVGHTWNIVWLDGTAFHVDASSGVRNFGLLKDFLTAAGLFRPQNALSYEYFAMSEQNALAGGRKTDVLFDGILPDCTYTFYDALYDVVAGNKEDFVSLSAAALKEKKTDAHPMLRIKCMAESAYKEILSGLGKLPDGSKGYVLQIMEKADVHGTVDVRQSNTFLTMYLYFGTED